MSFAPILDTGKRKTRASRAAAGKFSRSAIAMLAAIVLCDSAILFLRAGSKPLWYDELLTLHISALHPFSVLQKALYAGVDGMPAAYYATVQIARALPLDPHIAARLPSILGYVLTLLGVSWFTRKRLQPLVALTAVLLVSVSPFRTYSVEARSYSLLVGALAIAAMFWQRVGERRLFAPLFGLFLAFAVSLHYLVWIRWIRRVRYSPAMFLCASRSLPLSKRRIPNSSYVPAALTLRSDNTGADYSSYGVAQGSPRALASRTAD